MSEEKHFSLHHRNSNALAYAIAALNDLEVPNPEFMDISFHKTVPNLENGEVGISVLFQGKWGTASVDVIMVPVDDERDLAQDVCKFNVFYELVEMKVRLASGEHKYWLKDAAHDPFTIERVPA